MQSHNHPCCPGHTRRKSREETARTVTQIPRFEGNSPALTPAGRTAASGGIDGWSISPHPHQSNTGTGLFLIPAKDRKEISEQHRHIYATHIYLFFISLWMTCLHSMQQVKAGETHRPLKAAVPLYHKYLPSPFNPAWKVKTSRHSFWSVMFIIQLWSCIPTEDSQGRILGNLPWKYLLKPINSTKFSAV